MKLRPAYIYGSITAATVVALAGLTAVQPAIAYGVAVVGLVALLALFYLAGRVE